MADGGDDHDVIRPTVTQGLDGFLQYHRHWMKEKPLFLARDGLASLGCEFSGCKDELWFGYIRHIPSLAFEGSSSHDKKVHVTLTSHCLSLGMGKVL